MCDGAAGEAMGDEYCGSRGEGGYHFVDRVDPVFADGGVPVPLLDAGKAVERFPAGLPVLGAGVVEAGEDETK